jgi:hypothetical protein
MYKKLLEKGFNPAYYTDSDFLEATTCKTRLFYRLRINNKDLLNSILNVLDKYNKYFSILLEPNLISEIEIEEDLSSYWLYNNTNIDNIEISSTEMWDILEILPNRFEFTSKDF